MCRLSVLSRAVRHVVSNLKTQGRVLLKQGPIVKLVQWPQLPSHHGRCRILELLILAKKMSYRRSNGPGAGPGSRYPVYPGSGASGVQGHEYLEEENTEREEEMRKKIGALKSLTIDIGAEVKEHNRLLRETDDLFDSVQGGLSNAMNKVRGLLSSGNRYHMLYLFAFCLFVFFVLWLII